MYQPITAEDIIELNAKLRKEDISMMDIFCLDEDLLDRFVSALLDDSLWT